ncbi:hypothetical protein [Streptomyces oceani]|uniref:hypothetical protein n=1 Tax=Streptomyces oceani TaxID=1075402 RepID=UPI0008722D3A|nr:hypothetical protein [Streptomyces oceani]
MQDSRKAALTAAIAAGYVLGRTRKGKVALTLASIAAGRRLSVSPQDLLTHGVRTLKDSPQFGRLSEQVRGELAESGRTALTSATDRTMNSLADRLQQRTQALQAAPDDTNQQRDQQRDQEGEGEDQGGGDRASTETKSAKSSAKSSGKSEDTSSSRSVTSGRTRRR